MPADRASGDHRLASVRQPKIPMMTEASEYDGQSEIAVSCTQLGTAYTARLAKKVVAEWVELLKSPTPLTSLQFTSRTPKRLFAALAGQPQLLRLVVKWGDYEDLSPVASMTSLRHLELRGATAISNVAALASLTTLELLALEGFRSIEDLSPLGNLRALTDLEIGGAWMTPRNGHVSSIRFLTDLPQLEKVLLHTLVVDDLDYTPLLHLPRLRSVRVMKVRGMQPSHDELRRQLPWSA